MGIAQKKRAQFRIFEIICVNEFITEKEEQRPHDCRREEITHNI
jgi:hypothetical protein